MRARLFSRLSIVAIIISLILLSLLPIAYADTILQRIETEKYPTVKLLLSNMAFDEGSSEEHIASAVEIRENGSKISDVRVSSLKTKPEPLSVVMLIDASGSMKGRPINDARVAANHFIRLLSKEDQISVISFSSTPSLLVDFTSNKKKLTDAVNAVQASGETAVYDALALAIQQTSRSGLKQRYIILLSDGGDTVSKTQPKAIIERVKETRVPVYTIALKSPEFDVGVLESVSIQSGGKLVQAITSSDLKPFYLRLAKQIKSNVELTYTSPGFDTKDIDLDIVIGKGNQSMNVATAYQNPALLDQYGEEEPVRIQPIVDNWMVRSGILLIAFAAAALLLYGAMSVVVRQRSPLKKQLGMYEDLLNSDSINNKVFASDKNPYVSRALDIIGHFAEKRGLIELVRGKLEQAGLPLRSVEYIFFHLLLISVPSTLLHIAYGNILLTAVFILLLTILPMLIVQLLVDRRQRRFSSLLPDTLTMIAGSLRAGYSLLQAIALVSDESEPPISVEFRRALTEARLGLPIEMALEKVARRIQSEDFNWTILAINIQRDVGGNLAEVLDIVAKTIREREALRRQVRALSAEGRISAYILIAMPFVMAFLMFLINPEYMRLLFTHVIGWVMVGISGILMVIGVFWMKKIVSIEV